MVMAKRLCHVNFDNLINIRKMKKVRRLPKLKKPNKIMCKQYQLRKMKKSNFKSKTYTSNELLELVHTNLCGPIEIKSYIGDRYIMLFVDDYSIMMTFMFLKQKLEAFQMFKWYLAQVEKETGKNLKCLRSDRGGEFTSKEFENRIAKIYDSHGSLIGKGDQTRSNLFYLDMEDASCLIVQTDDVWL